MAKDEKIVDIQGETSEKETKESFWTRAKKFTKKLVNSKPAKIVAGVFIAAGSASIGYTAGKKNCRKEYFMVVEKDHEDEEELEFIELDSEESTEESVDEEI